MDADHEHPGLISDEMRAQGITFIVIGIGSGTNQTEINHIAGGPDNAFSAASFDELIGGEFIGMLKDKTCKVGKLKIIFIRTERAEPSPVVVRF